MAKIKEIRTQLKVTQERLARDLNLTQGAVAHFESGRRTPSLDMSRKIVAALNKYGANCSLEGVFPNNDE